MTKARKSNPLIKGKRLYLREVNLSDVNKDYLRWMNDVEVVKFLESRFKKWSIKELKAYVKKIKNNPDYLFLAIVLKNGHKHIGNIKMGPINRIRNFAAMGIIIGERPYWGKGFATEAIKLATEYTFRKLNLHKIVAGVYHNNRGSMKAFKKAGFSIEAVRKYYYNRKYVDSVLLANIRK